MTAPERRPFTALADNELEMIITGLYGEAVRRGEDTGLKYARLGEVAWQELALRRAYFRSLREGKFPDPQRCPRLSSPLGQPFRPIHCEGLDGHDGPHFIGSHLTRREWR